MFKVVLSPTPGSATRLLFPIFCTVLLPGIDPAHVRTHYTVQHACPFRFLILSAVLMYTNYKNDRRTIPSMYHHSIISLYSIVSAAAAPTLGHSSRWGEGKDTVPTDTPRLDRWTALFTFRNVKRNWVRRLEHSAWYAPPRKIVSLPCMETALLLRW